MQSLLLLRTYTYSYLFSTRNERDGQEKYKHSYNKANINVYVGGNRWADEIPDIIGEDKEKVCAILLYSW